MFVDVMFFRSLMGNKSKQGQYAQRHVNDYERSRMLRVQDSQGKLQEFGVKNIAESLRSLVDSQTSKKRKVKLMVTNERDVEYIPIFVVIVIEITKEVAKIVASSKKVTNLATFVCRSVACLLGIDVGLKKTCTQPVQRVLQGFAKNW